PAGADAVVMVEDTEREESRVTFLRPAKRSDNVVRCGSEAPAGKIVLRRGRTLGSGEVSLLASLGAAQVRVFRQLHVAILTTGDELVPVDARPEWFQIRDSNAFALRAQVAEAGGIPHSIGIAPDRPETIRAMIQQCLEQDCFVLSGGVSAGKYDFVERVLEEMGAEFYFRSVAIRPGKPLVFGKLQSKFFFGLPGNPVSAYVTFEVFARYAIRALGGVGFDEPVFLGARLAKPVAPKAGLTTFIPARVEMDGSFPLVDRLPWQGSGDLAGAAAANCFLVMRPGEGPHGAGDWVTVMPKRD
ncbi:MAG: molybdopterin molybdotransferase MoeA, partial [Terriglobia bacterium]